MQAVWLYGSGWIVLRSDSLVSPLSFQVFSACIPILTDIPSSLSAFVTPSPIMYTLSVLISTQYQSYNTLVDTMFGLNGNVHTYYTKEL